MNLKYSASSIALWQTPALDEAGAAAMATNQENNEAEQEYQRGYEEGRQEALHDCTAEIREKLDVVAALLQSLHHPLEALNDQVAEQLALLAGRMARSLVRRELRTDPQTIMALVRDTVAALNTSSQDIDIHLNPEDADVLRELAHLSNREQGWTVVDDPMIPRGDCKVAHGDAVVDGNLQSKIDIMITQMLGDERGERGHE